MTRVNDTRLTELLGRALEETMSLLGSCVFSAEHGAYRQGALAAVSVMATPAEEPGAHHVLVMCHDPGHLGIDYEGIPLILIERLSGDERIGFLDGRGRAEFLLGVPATSELCFEPVAPQSLATMDVPSEMLAGHFAPAGIKPVRIVQSKSPDAALSAVAERVGRGLLNISVQAHSEQLQNATVRVVLRSRKDPSDVWLTRKIKLNVDNGMKGSWRGRIGAGELQNRSEDAILLVLPPPRH